LIVHEVGICSNLTLHDLDHDRGEDTSDCVNRIVARKAFAEKALKGGGDGCLVCENYLVLYDHVGGCVNSRMRELDTCATVMLFDKRDLFSLSEAGPPTRARRVVWIVFPSLALHLPRGLTVY